jgi:hypothetical protein
MRAGLISVLVLSAWGVGCATPQAFVFRPTEIPNVTRDNQAVARYVVPRALPRGEIFVMSEGVASAGENAPELHVRVTLYNVAGEAPWAIDTRDQIVTLPAGPQLHPSRVKTAAQGAPILTISTGERIAMDLYFNLPEQARTADTFANFDFIWQVTTDRKVAAGSVPFGRFLSSGAARTDTPMPGASPAIATSTPHAAF